MTTKANSPGSSRELQAGNEDALEHDEDGHGEVDAN